MDDMNQEVKCSKCGGTMTMEGDMMKCACGNTMPKEETKKDM